MGKGDKVRLIDNKDHKYHGEGIIVKTQTISNNIVYITVEHIYEIFINYLLYHKPKMVAYE